MIAQYPSWTKFSTRHIKECDEFTRNFPPYISFSATEMITWYNFFGDLHLCMLNNNLVLRFHDVFSDGTQKTLTLIGDTEIDITIQTLFELQKQNHDQPLLSGVPDFVVKQIKTPRDFITESDDSNAEYVLSSELLTHLQGSAIGKTRYEVNRFIRDTSAVDVKVFELDFSRYENKVLFINALHLWDHVYTKNDVDRLEGLALDHMLPNAEALQMRCLAVMVQGSFEGFCLFRKMPQPGFANVPHIKTSYRFPYTFNFLLHRTAELLLKEGVTHINLEQDLGIPGLRQHKQDLQPVYMLKKHAIAPAAR